MASIITWIGTALIVVGAAGVISTAAVTAAIPAIFGLALLGLGLLARRPARANFAILASLAVALLGVVAPLGNVARLAGSGGLGLNAASFSNIVMAGLCAALLALWALDRYLSRNGKSGLGL
jgi:hypothetical protein